MENVWIQLIITGGAVLTGIFFTIRYAMSQVAKREQALLEHTQKTQETMLSYFETKNGHMERMAKQFTNSSNKMSKAVSELSTIIKNKNGKRK